MTLTFLVCGPHFEEQRSTLTLLDFSPFCTQMYQDSAPISLRGSLSQPTEPQGNGNPFAKRPFRTGVPYLPQSISVRISHSVTYTGAPTVCQHSTSNYSKSIFQKLPAHLMHKKWHGCAVLICICLSFTEVKYVSIHLLTICLCPSIKSLLASFAHFPPVPACDRFLRAS